MINACLRSLSRRRSKWLEERLKKAAYGDNEKTTSAHMTITQRLIEFDTREEILKMSAVPFGPKVNCNLGLFLIISVHFQQPAPLVIKSRRCGDISNSPCGRLNMRVLIVKIHAVQLYIHYISHAHFHFTGRKKGSNNRGENSQKTE